MINSWGREGSTNSRVMEERRSKRRCQVSFEKVNDSSENVGKKFIPSRDDSSSIKKTINNRNGIQFANME